MNITNKTTIDELNARYAELAIARGIDAPAPADRKELIAEIKRLEAIPPQFDEESSDSSNESLDGDEYADEQSEVTASVSDEVLEPSAALEQATTSNNEPSATVENQDPQVDEELVKIHPLCTIRAEYEGVAYEVFADQASALVPKVMAEDLISGGYATLLDV